MGGIFSKPKAPPPPDPSIDANLRKQEEKNTRDEASSRRRLAARASARRTGGARMLMAPGVFGETARGRDVANLTNTLGAGRNPRG
tara:strand:+ start:1022 stop:1279 length:258 start_codon:yes stop_codon:yes gene_type:complete